MASAQKKRKQRKVYGAYVDIDNVDELPGVGFKNWIRLTQQKLQQREAALMTIRLECVRKALCDAVNEFNVLSQNQQFGISINHEIFVLNDNIIVHCIKAINEILMDWNGIELARSSKQFQTYRSYFVVSKNWFDQRKKNLLSKHLWFRILTMIKTFSEDAAASSCILCNQSHQNLYSRPLLLLILIKLFQSKTQFTATKPQPLVPGASLRDSSEVQRFLIDYVDVSVSMMELTKKYAAITLNEGSHQQRTKQLTAKQTLEYIINELQELYSAAQTTLSNNLSLIHHQQKCEQIGSLLLPNAVNADNKANANVGIGNDTFIHCDNGNGNDVVNTFNNIDSKNDTESCNTSLNTAFTGCNDLMRINDNLYLNNFNVSNYHQSNHNNHNFVTHDLMDNGTVINHRNNWIDHNENNNNINSNMNNINNINNNNSNHQNDHNIHHQNSNHQNNFNDNYNKMYINNMYNNNNNHSLPQSHNVNNTDHFPPYHQYAPVHNATHSVSEARYNPLLSTSYGWNTDNVNNYNYNNSNHNGNNYNHYIHNNMNHNVNQLHHGNHQLPCTQCAECAVFNESQSKRNAFAEGC